MRNASSVIALAFVGFAVVLAGFIGSRLNEQAVALLAGTVLGVALALPIGIAIGWYVKSSRTSHQASSQAMMIVPQPTASAAAQYMKAANPWSSAYPIGQGAPLLAPRQFTIVGEEPVNYESDTVW
jgi:hypothetical protein